MQSRLPLALIGLALALPLAHAADPEHIAKPAVQVGTTWRMRVADGMTKLPISEIRYRVAAVTDTEVQLVDEANEVIAVLDAGHYAIKRHGDIAFEPPLQRLRFPLAPGDRWETSYQYVSPQCGPMKATLAFRAMAWEDVSVPAGRFRALRLESEGMMRSGCGTNRQAHKLWAMADLPVPIRQESTFYGGPRITRFEVQELLDLSRP